MSLFNKSQKANTMSKNITLKNKNKNKANQNKKTNDLIQHHHLLIRAETQTCPKKEDKDKMKSFVEKLIKDIEMAPLSHPETFYVTEPRYNEGLTAIVPIQTSHIAFHFWANPSHTILHNVLSKCLLQFDIYTCGKLTKKQIKHILHELTAYQVSHIDVTLLNRKWSLTIDKHSKWDSSDSSESWNDWIQEF